MAGFLLAGLLVVGAFAVGVLAGAAPANGEDLSAYLPAGIPGYGIPPGSVQARPHPLFEPIGVRVGSFLLHPRLGLDMGYDSNLFGSTPGRGSWLLGTHASLLAGSDWSRDSLGAFVGVDDLRTPNSPDQGRTDWTGSVGGSLDIDRDKLILAAAHLSLHQDRTAIDALPTDRPVAYQVNDLRASYLHTFNRLSLTPGLEFAAYRFAEATIMGVPSPQSDRDRNILVGNLTASYQLAPQRNLVVVLRALDSRYTAPVAGAPSRNSTGLVALAGIEQGDAVWDVRLLVGWQQRSFAASQFGSRSAPAAEADVAWSPSGLTTVSATLARTIEDAAQEGVAGYVLTSARLHIDHEYRRNVMLHGTAGVQHAVFTQGGGAQTAYTLGVSVTWLMNRRLRLSATEAFTDLRSIADSSTPGTGSYCRNVMLLTVGFGL